LSGIAISAATRKKGPIDCSLCTLNEQVQRNVASAEVLPAIGALDPQPNCRTVLATMHLAKCLRDIKNAKHVAAVSFPQFEDQGSSG
jgi:hypothetical protein